VPYGEARDQLGLADDHGGAAAAWGPALAAPGSDGTWWALDVQKSRVARFSRTGAFLGATPIPQPNANVRAPRVLGGWLYASGDPALLSSATAARRVAEPFPFQWTYDDGTSVYSAYGDNAVYSLRVVDGELVTARGEYMLTPSGNRFRFEMRGRPIPERVLELQLPDASPALRLRLHLTSAQSGRPVEASVQVAADSNGTIYLYLLADDAGTQLAALTAVTASGDIAYTEQTPNPNQAGDPGDPWGRLHVVPGSSRPSLVFDEERGMAVYSRIGSAHS
jgi:hypothetical protein